MTEVSSPSGTERRGRSRAPVWLATGLFALVIGGLACFSDALDIGGSTRAAFDESVYHLPEAQRIAETFPRMDLSGSRAATTPGYHWLLAGSGLSHHAVWARLFAVAAATTMIALIGWWSSARLGGWKGAAAALTLGASPYVVLGSAWAGPEATGWLGSVTVLLLASSAGMSARRLLAIAGVLALLMAFRQSHLWTAAAVWTAAWLTPAVGSARWGWLGGWSKRVPSALLGVLATLPAFAVVGAFAATWGGLVPPNFQGGVIDPRTGSPFPVNAGTNPAAVTLVLSLLGVFGPWFTVAAWPTIQRRATELGWRTVIGVGGGAAALGALLGALPASTLSVEDGRFGGLWLLADVGPVFAERSVTMILLSGVGGACLSLLILAAPTARDRLVPLSAMVASTTAVAASANAWQRYAEATVLIVLIMLLSASSARSKLGVGALLALAAVQLSLTVLALR